jgi:hypothetical protein
MAYSTGRRCHRDKRGARLRASAAGDLGDKGADQRVPLLEDLGFQVSEVRGVGRETVVLGRDALFGELEEPGENFDGVPGADRRAGVPVRRRPVSAFVGLPQAA